MAWVIIEHFTNLVTRVLRTLSRFFARRNVMGASLCKRVRNGCTIIATFKEKWRFASPSWSFMNAPIVSCDLLLGRGSLQFLVASMYFSRYSHNERALSRTGTFSTQRCGTNGRGNTQRSESATKSSQWAGASWNSEYKLDKKQTTCHFVACNPVLYVLCTIRHLNSVLERGSSSAAGSHEKVSNSHWGNTLKAA